MASDILKVSRFLAFAICAMMFLTASAQESLQATLGEFVKDMSGAALSPEMERYISETLRTSYTDEQIKELSIKHPYSKALKEINAGDKKLGNALTMVSALSQRIKNQRTIAVKSIGNTDAEEVEVVFTLGQYDESSTWKRNERGQWQLTATNMLEDERLDVYDGITVFERYVDSSFEWGMALPMTKVATMGFAFSWYYYGTTVMRGVSFELGKFTFKNKEGEKDTAGCFNLMGTVGWQKQYMLKNKSLLYPYAKLNFGMSLANGLIWGGSPGARYGWRSQKGNIFFLFTECDLRYFKEFSSRDAGVGNHMTAGLKFGVGIGLK